MTDQRNPLPVTPSGTPGVPVDTPDVLPPEQPPMDDAAGGPDVADDNAPTGQGDAAESEAHPS